jgi:hypothetical protein
MISVVVQLLERTDVDDAVRVPLSTVRGIGSPDLRDAGDVYHVDTWCMDVYARISDW